MATGAVYYSPLMDELKVRNEELKEHVEQLKQEVDYERNQVKHVKEEKVREVKLAREQEQAKATAENEDLKQKLQRQMQSDLLSKVDSIRKEWDIEVASLRKTHKQELDSLIEQHNSDKKSLLEKLEVDKKKFKEDWESKNKKEADRFIKEVFKLQTQVEELHETIENLKQENKRMKDNLVKQKSEYNKETGDTDRQYRNIHQKQIEELKEKERIILEKDKLISELRRKCTTMEMAKEKVEIDLQIAKKLGASNPPTSIGLSRDINDGEDAAMATTELLSRMNKREEDLLITNSELGALVKRMRNELQNLKKEKGVTDVKLKVAEDAVEPLKRRREEDVKRILDLTHTVDLKEKRFQQTADENKALIAERDKMKKELEAAKAALIHHKVADKRDGDANKARRLLAAKTKEMDEIMENNAKLNREIFKLKEEADRQRKERMETRKNQIASSAPHSPAVEKRVKDHRRLVELEQAMKDMTDKLGESQRMKARLNQRMEDLNESLKRRDKRIKQINDDNYKLRSTNQLLEEARNRTHEEITEEWDKTRSELDRAHAQINRLQQENNTLLEELGRRTPRPISPGTHLSPRYRSRSPSPRRPINDSLSPRQPVNESPRQPQSPNRTRSLSPRMRTPSPSHRLKPPSSENQSAIPMKIPIAKQYTTSPHPPLATPPDSHIPLSPISPSSNKPLSPLILSSSSTPPTHSSPQNTFMIQIPQVEAEQISLSEQSLDPDFSSEISLESLKDRLELVEFEKEESKIWHDEQKEEFSKLKVKYNLLKERYHSLFKRARGMSKKLQLAHKERLEMDLEVARLQSDKRAGIEFDVEREANLREKLNLATDRVTGLEEEISRQLKENEELQINVTIRNEEKERMETQLNELREQLLEMETDLKESESLMVEKKEVIDTKEKQMVQLERMLVEKDEELHKATTALESLQQKMSNDPPILLSPRQQEPWQHMRPQIVGCIESAQSTTNEIKKCLKPTDIPGDDASLDVNKINGLTQYVQQVLEEAKEHVTAATNASPIATPTEENTDSATPTFHTSPSQDYKLQETLEQFEAENTELKGKIVSLEDRLVETEDQLRKVQTNQTVQDSAENKHVHVETSTSNALKEDEAPHHVNDTTHHLMEENESLKSQIVSLEDRLVETEDQLRNVQRKHTVMLKDSTENEHVQTSSISKEDEAPHHVNDTTHHLMEENESLKSQVKLLISQIADDGEKEIELQKVIEVLKEKLAAAKAVQPVLDPEVKNQWFNEWMKQFNKEKKKLHKKIKDLELRNGEASQRVNDLLKVLEDRMAEGTDSAHNYETTDFTHSYEKNNENNSQLKLQQENQSTESSERYSIVTPPTSLGLNINKSFQQTQLYVGRGDLNQARMELQTLERSLSELLKVVYPQGIVSPVPVVPPRPSESVNSWTRNGESLSPDPKPFPGHTHSSPHPHPLSISLSPVTVSSSEAELTHFNDTAGTSMGTQHTPSKLKIPRKATTRSGSRLFVTLLDYNPLSLCNTGHPERELTLRTGDVIAVTGEMDANGFYNGIFEGRCGLVPAKFLEEMDIVDENVHKRLLNQNLSSSLSPSSLHGSEVDITSTPSTHRIVPMTFESVVIASDTSIPQGPRPSPPSQLTVKASASGESVLVTWKHPNIDENGCSNGFHVTGYTVKCDGVIHMSVGETNRFTKQAYLEEAEPNEIHTISVCTQSKEGVASAEVTAEYNPNQELNRNANIRSSQRSQAESIDSIILEKTKYVVATHGYTPSEDSPNTDPDQELAFTKGQIIKIYGNMRDDGFYYGEGQEGVVGLVPSSYIADIQQTRPQLPHVPMTINPAHVQTPPPKQRLFVAEGVV